ncbi:MAG: SUMF1/EgtB/PvdO family nonheme iron enzyme, partial [Treponema sp.]|nr:SUMF1/EgtB/PvdO family nonheme iron enzyme [Treponema sp.]
TLEAPVRTGYDFDGWFVTENFSDSAIETIGGGAKGEITLYAKWTPVTYKISYELDGGTNASANPATYTIETDSITLAKPQKDGFTFSGWYADSSFSGTKQTTIEKGSHVDKKYYAKWLKNCTVSYITAHSTAPTAIIVGEGEKLTAEQLPELTSSDYFFGGWYSGETCVTAGSYTVTDDVTLTAKWSDKCTVSYVTDHGTAPQVFVVESGTVLTVDNLPKLKETGWKFLGWYTNSSYDEDKIASAGQSVTANITLYAKWKEFTGPDDDFVFVEGGTFSMGSTSGDSDEKPVHNVTLSSFYICDHELTQGEYVTVIGTNPSNFKSSPASEEVQENRPVEYVSWFDTIYFCNKYSESVGLTPCYKVNGNANVTSWSYTPHNGNSISGTITCDMTANGYRLPTEAEWEYAAKGGNQSNGYTYSGSNNIDSVAWYTSNSNSKTHEVKKKSANELGLFDMNGNVWEWCWDCYTSSYSNESVTDPCGNSSGSIRVLRGGSWGGLATGCRSAVRLNNDPYYRNSSYGFRLVRTDTSSCYMISYQTAHGTEPEQTLVRKSITNTELPMLTESGWKFLGWYTSSNFDEVTKANAGQSITTNLTLYAKWEEFTGPDDGFVFVEGGTVVGSDDYNQNRNSETCYIGAFPAGRTVTLSSFYMSNHELTQGEYETYCCYTEDTPRSRYGVGVDYPAYYVSWYDAIVYCNLKSIAEGLTPCYSLSGETDPKKWAGIKSSNGKYSCSYTSSNSTWNSITCNMTANGYRLPTEAEWEYAARGGYETYGTSAFANYFAGATTTNYNASENSDLNSVAWYYYNSSSKTHEVMKKTPNALGLYDMSGNVSEWCWDWYSDSVGTGSVTDPCGASTGSYRLGRGGSWGDYTYYCSVSSRTYINPYCRHYGISFRLVRSATNGSTNTESGNSYANQTQTYSFTSTVTVLPSGTDGTTGTGAKYILFGDWPQTIKADNVTVDENINEVHGSFTYYGGSDGYWYVKCKENAYESGYKYSNGTPVAQISVNSTKYFKVEPIKWRVLTENYKRTGKALLLAEKF